MVRRMDDREKAAAEELGKELLNTPGVSKKPQWGPPKEDWHPSIKQWWTAMAKDPMAAFHGTAMIGTAKVLAESLSLAMKERFICVTPRGDEVFATMPLEPGQVRQLLAFSTAFGMDPRSRAELGVLLRFNDAEVTQIAGNAPRVVSRREQIEGAQSQVG